MELSWWHWAVGGIALIIAELVVPSFVIVWFGLAAFVVALAVAMADLSLTTQLALWLIASLAMLSAWFRIFRPNQFKTRIGLSDANVIGEIGLLTRRVAPFEKGEVRFQKPVLGADLWPCIADEEIEAGSRVKVLAVEGTFVKVGRA